MSWLAFSKREALETDHAHGCQATRVQVPLNSTKYTEFELVLKSLERNI